MQCECSTSEIGVRSVAELQWTRALQTQTSPAFRTTVSSDGPRQATWSRTGNGVPIVSQTDTGAADPGPDDMPHILNGEL